jgi:hypothetical protein
MKDAARWYLAKQSFIKFQITMNIPQPCFTSWFTLSLALLCSFTFAQAKTQHIKSITDKSAPASLKGHKFLLEYQAFASHDKEGTSEDTVSNKGDYILFAVNGNAYLHFKGQSDSIGYRLSNPNTMSFGDTPFQITSLGNGLFSLYQNEEEVNGDYNRVTYLLKEDETYQQSEMAL